MNILEALDGPKRGNRLPDVLPGAEDVLIYVVDLELMEALLSDGGWEIEILADDCQWDKSHDIKIARINHWHMDDDDDGRVEWSVEIWRCDMPAQFYCFRIRDAEGNQHIITTGSGSLASFWPTIELVGGAMWYQHSEEN